MTRLRRQFYFSPSPSFTAPTRQKPSLDYHGEATVDVVYEAVGRALSAWEHSESAWAKGFQLFCETRSLAAVRAYGVIESVATRNAALLYAATEFFSTREAPDFVTTKTHLKVHLNACLLRNRIAHGMVVQPHAYGYFLCPPSYATKQRKARAAYPTERWGLGADYFYRAREIDAIRRHFEAILASTMSLVLYLNEKYEVLAARDFHP